MKILVTGGAGYVGSHCSRELCDFDHSVVVFDNLSGGYRDAVDSRAELIVGDLADREHVERVFEDHGFDAVMHFAGSINVGESTEQPVAYYTNNAANTFILLSVMRQHQVKRMIFSSTCAVYGVPPSAPLHEDMQREPINPYGRSKLAVEWALQDSVQAWGLGATALRYFNASGAASDGSIGEAHVPETHLIPLVLQVALGQREKISIFGTDYPTRDGTCVRDFVHVEDLAAAHRLALESQAGESFRAFNLGTGPGTTVRELIAAAREVTGHPIPEVESSRRPGDPPELYADSSRAREELGWEPRHVTVGSIVASAWTWQKTHPNGYE